MNLTRNSFKTCKISNPIDENIELVMMIIRMMEMIMEIIMIAKKIMMMMVKMMMIGIDNSSGE